jgi:hypothetical protein
MVGGCQSLHGVSKSFACIGTGLAGALWGLKKAENRFSSVEGGMIRSSMVMGRIGSIEAGSREGRHKSGQGEYEDAHRGRGEKDSLLS